MPPYDDFFDTLLPGNYALTKSMELTRVTNSGTLWYTKKFLTLYYYVFLSNDIETSAYRPAVVEIFDRYIASLPEAVRESAERFFYPEDGAINFKSEDFNLFANFAGRRVFGARAERTEYLRGAKKYYFALLMGSGGQTGIKARLKEAVRRPGFVYSHEAIEDIIFREAIAGCVRELNSSGRIADRSIKYIISPQALEAAGRLALTRPIGEGDVLRLCEEFPHPRPNYRGIESDMAAFIRNERQILYYYGYFHSRSTGAADFEFSSLTPVGELALQANAGEFLLLWEHQKLKMISQPATAEINQIGPAPGPEAFGVSFTPYTDILGYILRRGSMSLDEYKYIVSRRRHSFGDEEWEALEPELAARLPEIKARVASFGRARDCEDEDGRKELLKYLLGVRGDLPYDCGAAPLGALRMRRSRVEAPDRHMLALIYDVYSRLEDYKQQRYGAVLAGSEAELRRRYVSAANGNGVEPDGLVKIKWDLYNIHADRFILLSAAALVSAVSLGFGGVRELSRERLEAIAAYASAAFGGLFRSLGIRSAAAMRRELQKALAALGARDYSAYLAVEDAHGQPALARYRTESAAGLLERIEQLSAAATVSPAEDRQRSAQLVNLLKSYYMRACAENGTLRCECCGEEAFITAAGEPYVEFHHLIPFGIAYGPDHYLNLFALCPNCHRRLHFQAPADKHGLYSALSGGNYLRRSFAERLRALRAQNLLRSYHLEFLLADGAITAVEYDSIAA